MKKKATFRYNYYVGNRIVHRGITDDPARRAGEHRQTYGAGRMRVTTRPVSRERGLEWEREGGKLGELQTKDIRTDDKPR